MMGGHGILGICIVGFLAGIFLLWTFIQRVRRLIRESVEVTAPIELRQQIEFRMPGEKCLHVEGPLFTTAFARMSFTLQDKATGQAVPLRFVLFRSHVSGFSKVRLLLYRCTITHAGFFDLGIEGMKQDRDYSECRIVFTGPYVARAVLYVLGITLAANLTIAGLVLGILAFLGVL